MPDKKIRTSILVPKYHHDLLKLWAYFKCTGVSSLTQNIVQARVEANYEQIMLMLESRANDLGLTPEELKNKIINNEEDFNKNKN
jgi:hypothetical protein